VIRAHATAIGVDVMTIPEVGPPPVRDLMAQMIESAARRHRKKRRHQKRDGFGDRDEGCD
jgi:hypothetical protein